MNELNIQDIFVILCQCKTKQLNITAVCDTVYIQQCIKQNYEKDVIQSKLWILFKDMTRFISV